MPRAELVVDLLAADGRWASAGRMANRRLAASVLAANVALLLSPPAVGVMVLLGMLR